MENKDVTSLLVSRTAELPKLTHLSKQNKNFAPEGFDVEAEIWWKE